MLLLGDEDGFSLQFVVGSRDLGVRIVVIEFVVGVEVDAGGEFLFRCGFPLML